MTYHWTEADIIPGRWVYIPGPAESPGPFRTFKAEETASLTYHIGRDYTIRELDPDEQKATNVVYSGRSRDYRLVCIMDGRIVARQTKAEMAAHLNEGGFAPLAHKHLLATIDYLRDCHVAT